MSDYILSGRLTVNIKTDLSYADDDPETPTSCTLEFLIDEDLKDLGYEIEDLKISKFICTKVNRGEGE